MGEQVGELAVVGRAGSARSSRRRGGRPDRAVALRCDQVGDGAPAARLAAVEVTLSGLFRAQVSRGSGPASAGRRRRRRCRRRRHVRGRSRPPRRPLTRPAAISFSAARREATPQWARYLARRIQPADARRPVARSAAPRRRRRSAPPGRARSRCRMWRRRTSAPRPRRAAPRARRGCRSGRDRGCPSTTQRPPRPRTRAPGRHRGRRQQTIEVSLGSRGHSYDPGVGRRGGPSGGGIRPRGGQTASSPPSRVRSTPAQGAARCSPALSRRSRSSAASSGVGSKAATSGRSSSPLRPKSRSNSSVVL